MSAIRPVAGARGVADVLQAEYGWRAMSRLLAQRIQIGHGYMSEKYRKPQ
jgi:hypothetical protein